MVLEFILSGKIGEALKNVKAKKNVAEYAKEYHENDRKLRETQVGRRKDKRLKDGTLVNSAKIPVDFQSKIVSSASAFLFGNAPKITSQDPLKVELEDTWETCRLDALLLKFTETVKSETEATIVFFPVEKTIGGRKETKIKARVLTHENGVYYPVFDEYGDMVAFMWRFKSMRDGKEVEFLRVFTDESIWLYTKDKNEWTELSKDKNHFGKIPVVYHSQRYPEWWRVKELIDRFEMNLSKFADTNDYFASPMYKAKGAVKSIPKKDDTGKIVKLDIVETDSGKIIEADLDVISWDRAPEALKLEFDTEEKLIYALTDTPNLNTETLKGLGNLSGVGIEMMFFASIIKAKREQGDYRLVVSRCINILKAGIANIYKKPAIFDAKFNIEFTSVLPSNLKEMVDTLLTATGGRPIMSQETASALNPIADTDGGEYARIKGENRVDVFNLAD